MNIVILGASALATAQRLKALYPQAVIHGLRGCADGAERHYDEFGEHLRALYRAGQPLVVLCAAGIVIRSLAALLAEKGAEPPVLALAEDGSAVVRPEPSALALFGSLKSRKKFPGHREEKAAMRKAVASASRGGKA